MNKNCSIHKLPNNYRTSYHHQVCRQCIPTSSHACFNITSQHYLLQRFFKLYSQLVKLLKVAKTDHSLRKRKETFSTIHKEVSHMRNLISNALQGVSSHKETPSQYEEYVIDLHRHIDVLGQGKDPYLIANFIQERLRQVESELEHQGTSIFDLKMSLLDSNLVEVRSFPANPQSIGPNRCLHDSRYVYFMKPHTVLNCADSQTGEVQIIRRQMSHVVAKTNKMILGVDLHSSMANPKLVIL